MLMSLISVEIPISKRGVNISFNITEGVNMLLISFGTIQMCLIGDAGLCGDVQKLLVSIKT